MSDDRTCPAASSELSSRNKDLPADMVKMEPHLPIWGQRWLPVNSNGYAVPDVGPELGSLDVSTGTYMVEQDVDNDDGGPVYLFDLSQTSLPNALPYSNSPTFQQSPLSSTSSTVGSLDTDWSWFVSPTVDSAASFYEQPQALSMCEPNISATQSIALPTELGLDMVPHSASNGLANTGDTQLNFLSLEPRSYVDAFTTVEPPCNPIPFSEPQRGFRCSHQFSYNPSYPPHVAWNPVPNFPGHMYGSAPFYPNFYPNPPPPPNREIQPYYSSHLWNKL
ncbi:hypothetical protein DL96DRAFT_1014197 [Flagelloscypha sp. PMI_526]|nr:hypothetical protein DL96DRAFT_1014197 [Flagelloscypha sp. PMI_526]